LQHKDEAFAEISSHNTKLMRDTIVVKSKCVVCFPEFRSTTAIMRFTILVREIFSPPDGEIGRTTIAMPTCDTCKVNFAGYISRILVYNYSIQRYYSCKGKI